MKKSLIYVLIISLATRLCYAEEKRSPEEAHVYFTNRVVNNNNGETAVEYKTETTARATVVVNEEAYKQWYAEQKQKLKEELKKEIKEELKKEILDELMEQNIMMNRMSFRM